MLEKTSLEYGGIGLMSYSTRYTTLSDVTDEYWDELLVNHEKITEGYSDTTSAVFIASLNEEDKPYLQKILKLADYEDEIKWNEHLKTHKNFMDFLFLKEFLKRKKKAIDEIFDKKLPDNEATKISTVVKSIKLFLTNPSWLFEVLVLHEWRNKASGDVFTSTKKFTSKIVNSLSTEKGYQDTIANVLYNNSGRNNDYRIIAHCQLGEHYFLYMIYKLTKDTKRPGYDKAKRVKDRDQVMFAIQTEEKTLEIKAMKTDLRGIKKYFTDELGLTLNEIQREVFTEYKVKDIVRLFEEGTPVTNENPEDFVIDRISFSNSLLSKSPDLILQLNGTDIWPSVMDAFQRRVVDLNSLKDIKNISFHSSKHSKSIRSISLENGDVVFKLDDSNLSTATKTLINNNFFKKFGFPLDRPIKNKFTGGRALKIDQIFRFSRQDQLENDQKQMFDELITLKLLELKQDDKYSCNNCNFYTINKSEVILNTHDILECPECHNDIKVTPEEEIIANNEVMEKYIYDLFDTLLERDSRLETKGYSQQTIRKKKFKFKRFLFENRLFQVLVTKNVLSKRTLENIERKLIPTIVICYGVDQQTSDIYSLDTIEQLTFGQIYVNNDQQDFSVFMGKYIEDLNKRTHHLVVTAAMKAVKNLNFISGKTTELKDKYDDSDLEDDVFPVIKDMFPNSEKWGKELIGKPIPEGLFAIQYKENAPLNSSEMKYAFTYDCKFTKDPAGYTLGSGEHRKALHYVKQLNSLVDISTYCTPHEVTSHIFIGNKFRKRQIFAMADFFRREIVKGYTTKPVFIDCKDLAYLHEQISSNKEKIQRVPDIFFKQMVAIFTTDEVLITKEYIDDQFRDIGIAARSYSPLDTTELTISLTKKK
ncbi:hypothetical protein [Paenibacillus sp. IHB B 3415]|uniref:hypothetical protein n=1 Tax=Paenibacillus sp. IHB B 3415 TaxID=867080 RepID=UPI000ACEB0B6|nr:hypothetical protein [Paenibacillus sp. IHB B 3415]